jgi:hypothetical protein
MKKLFLFLALSLVLGYHSGFAQIRINDHGDEQLPGLPGGTDYLGNCDTLSTTFVGGNGNDGSIFTLKAKQDIIIQNLEGNINGSGTMKIYFHIGPYAGFENNPLAWTLIDSAFTTSAGANVPTLIPIPLNMEVDSGQLVSFYVTGNLSGADVNYTDGTSEGAIFSSNADLEIYEGQGMSYPFGGNFTPRIWNGRVNYCPNINYCDELTTTYAGGNGNDGVLFEVTSLQDAVIRTFDVSLADTGYVYIYYKSGTYAGATTNPGAWTLADSVLVGSAGLNVPTEIPIDLNLYMPQGQLYSFLITGNGLDGQSVNYSNGIAIGAPFVSDNSLQIREGEGFQAPWVGGNALPRVFNGTIHYCNPGADTAIVCQNLFTTNAAGNGNNGIMFDIDAKQDAVEIQSFDTYFSGSGVQEVRIYYKNGTHIGFDSNPASWTLLDSMSINVPASGTLVNIPIPVNVQIAPNNKMAFYIHSNGGVDYTNGVGITVPDTIFSQDNFIRFREGTGKASIFSANFNPRVFNGRINYCYLESWIGIEENQSLDGLNIWPNPNDGIFNLSMANSNEVFERVEIMNVEGQIIRQEQIVSNSIVSYDISGQPAGLYFVKVYTDKGTYSKKIVLTGN